MMSVDEQTNSPLRLKMIRRQHRDRRAKSDGDDDGKSGSKKSDKSRSSKGDSSSGSSSKSTKSKDKSSSSSTSSAKKSKSTSTKSSTDSKGSGGLPPVSVKGTSSTAVGGATGLSATTAPTSGQTSQADAISGQSSAVSKSSMNGNAQIAIIVGAVLGSLAVIAAIALIFMLCRWRKKDRTASASATTPSTSSRGPLTGSIDPYAVPPSASHPQQPFQNAAYPDPVYDPRDSRSVYEDRHLDGYEEKAPSDGYYDDYYYNSTHNNNNNETYTHQSSYPDYQRRAGHDSIY